MDVIGIALALLVWPGLMLVAMFFTGDLELPARFNEWLEERKWRKYDRAQLSAERVVADDDFSTGVLAGDEGWAADLDLGLTGERWWRYGLRETPTMLVIEQDDFVFERHWCVYEIDELEPRLIWAVPSAVPTIQNLLGETVRPRYDWEPRRGAIHYPWKPVPAYVARSLGATAAWAGRQEIGAWL